MTFSTTARNRSDTAFFIAVAMMGVGLILHQVSIMCGYGDLTSVLADLGQVIAGLSFAACMIMLNSGNGDISHKSFEEPHFLRIITTLGALAGALVAIQGALTP